MKFLVNENVFEPIAELLRNKGHEVLNIRFSDLSGAADDKIYAKAVAENLTIVTMDKDFTRLLRFPPEHCAGIIVIKIYKYSVVETTALFDRYFSELDEERISGKLVIINPDGSRIRGSNPQE